MFPHKRAILIDDEIGSLRNLTYLIETYCQEEIEIVASTQTPEKGITMIESYQPDILFLDIKMPRMDGFQLLEKIENHDFFLIFTTAFSEYGIKALKASAIDYLLKPINPLELKEAVQKVMRLSQLQEKMTDTKQGQKQSVHLLLKNLEHDTYPKQIMIPHKDELKMVNVDQIQYISAEINYSIVYMVDGVQYVVSKTLKLFEELLSKEQFIRVHKSHLINRKFIKETVKREQYYVVLLGGVELPIARRRVKAVMEKLLIT